MLKNIYLVMNFIVTVLLTISKVSPAQISRIRNQIFIGARPMGMGETFVAVADDGNAIYWNPAGLPYIDRYELQAMHANLFNTSIANNYLSFLIPDLPYLPYSEKLAFGLDWFHIGVGEDGLEVSQNRFSFSTGYRPFKSISLGFNLKYLNDNAASDSKTVGKGSGWGYDLGLLASPWRGLSLGLMVYDLTNTRMRYDNGVSRTVYFRNVRYGAAYKFTDFYFLKQPLVAIDVDDRFHVGAETWLQNILGLRAGLQKDLYSQGEKELTFSCGAGIRYKYVQFDYALTSSPLLENTHRFSLSLNFALPPSPVTIKSITIEDIYASLFMYYRSFPCVVSELEYEGEKNIECALKLREKTFGIVADKKSEINPRLEGSKQVNFSLSLPQEILNLAPLAKHPTNAEVVLEPRTFIKTRAEKIQSPDFNIYGRGTINWANGVDQAAAFICPQDKLIVDFALKIGEYFRDFSSELIINQNISQAIQVYNALQRYGIRYQGDLHTPYAQSSKSVDTILYPFELLEKKQGDCDDTTVLYAALLENLRIPTALIAVPRHILLMFDTGIHEREKLMLCVEQDRYVLKDHHVWLPIETTFYCENKSFLDAWNKGMEQYNSYRTAPGFEIVDVHDAWEKYEPITWERVKIEIPFPDSTAVSNLYNSVKQSVAKETARFLDENYYRPLRTNPSDVKKINELSLIKIWRGDIDDGVKDLRKVINK